MHIDWLHFTPLSSFAGGLLIGLAAALLLLAEGRILGVTGIFGGLVTPQPGQWRWRLALVAGLMAAAPVSVALLATAPPAIHTPAFVLIAAGLLVGAGTRLANGCTSGHGICGLAHLSPRSAAATVSFMAAGFLMVFIVRHVLG